MFNQIDKFLKQEVRTREWFARQIGVGVDAVSRYANGKRIPTKEIMQKIYEVTGGHVRPDHFYDLPEPTQNLLPREGCNKSEMVCSSFVGVVHDPRNIPSAHTQTVPARPHGGGDPFALPGQVPLLPEVFHT